MKVPFIDLSGRQNSIQREINAALKRIFSSQRFILGEYNQKLETEVVKKTGAKFAIGVANGSDALYLALLALGVGEGDEVITTPFSFFATAGSISRTGARPVFADIDARTFNLDPSKIAPVITKKTKAILPVHLFGLSADMKAILKIAGRRSIPVVEDAAQSFGAACEGRQTGAVGDVGCYSFYPTKNLGGAGDGGMVVTSSAAVAGKLKLLRNHGMNGKYRHEVVGINSRLDEIQAAVILAKLKHVDEWNRLRIRHAKDYERGMRGLPVITPIAPKGLTHVYHLYSILTDRRDELHAFLEKKAVGSGVYYPVPLHLQVCYRWLGYKKGSFPVSEQTAARILSLPMFPGLGKKAKARVIHWVREFFGQ